MRVTRNDKVGSREVARNDRLTQVRVRVTRDDKVGSPEVARNDRLTQVRVRVARNDKVGSREVARNDRLKPVWVRSEVALHVWRGRHIIGLTITKFATLTAVL